MSRAVVESEGMTEEVLAQMLRENTGRSFMDSGDAYGRNWQRNQDRDFGKEKPASVSFRLMGDGDFEVEYQNNLYHWLLDRLEFDSEVNRRFENFLKKFREEFEGSDLSAMQEFADDLWEKGQASGLYGEGKPFCVNTYNGEDSLSQVIQYVYFETEGSGYVILQIHGGCDVRGGYTSPKVFRCKEDLAIMDNADGAIFCLGKQGHSWHTDDGGYNWYSDGDSVEDLKHYKATGSREKKGKGWLYIRDGKGYCPVCGSRIVAGVW